MGVIFGFTQEISLSRALRNNTEYYGFELKSPIKHVLRMGTFPR